MLPVASDPLGLSPSETCFALLDDCTATAQHPRSRLYTDHAGTLVCHKANELKTLFDAMVLAMRSGLHAVGLFSYELGRELQGATPATPTQPLVRVLLFSRQDPLSGEQVHAWLAARGTQAQAGIKIGRAHV